jgi:hypothetical protein
MSTEWYIGACQQSGTLGCVNRVVHWGMSTEWYIGACQQSGTLGYVNRVVRSTLVKSTHIFRIWLFSCCRCCCRLYVRNVLTCGCRLHVLDARRTTGGFVSSGFQLGYDEVAATVGESDAIKLWTWVREAGGVLAERARTAGCPLEPTPTLEVSFTLPTPLPPSHLLHVSCLLVVTQWSVPCASLLAKVPLCDSCCTSIGHHAIE